MDKRIVNTNIYEVVMYNTEVRTYVINGDAHPKYDEGWADSRYIELPAKNVRSVIKKIRTRFSRARGFKLVAITEIPGYTFNKRERF
jgi:hypothetical protein